MKVGTLLFAVLTICLVQSSIGARIVVLYLVAAKSHMFAVMPAIEELAKRGHEVTVFTPYNGIAKNVPNAREVFLSKTIKEVEERSVNWFEMMEAKATLILRYYRSSKNCQLKAAKNF